jgi:hypothetical protein
MFIFVPLAMIMSPGFWSAAQGPSHCAEYVTVVPPYSASPFEVTVIV